MSSINLLLDYKRYRDLEFSLGESLDIIKTASLDGYIEKLEEKVQEAEKRQGCIG